MREALAPTSESKCLHLPSVASAGLAPVMAERPVRECNSSKKCLKHFFDTLRSPEGKLADQLFCSGSMRQYTCLSRPISFSPIRSRRRVQKSSWKSARMMLTSRSV